ncbi:13957_t:CDS:2 [Dentiscutata erythropus]|uniref:13957_t:CDS:1 n=1 Tax=Dentiscutata erythropus TaxID=1348616 RepID=A0A9N8VSQ8_9GLOM|nr:13957_t:CDS:2 [Dentiscutata erythropus]
MKNEKKHEKKLDKRNDDAFLAKLNQFCCYIQRCLLNINQQAVLKRYQEMKNLKMEYMIFNLCHS